jgi:hypothetical protein
LGAIIDIHNEWRDSLRIASFRGVYFHVETSGRSSGRRTVTHQYPKRNLPYAEDMGREAVHWQFTAYIVLNDKKMHASANRTATGAPFASLIAQRNALVEALEMDGPGELIHPSLSIGFGGGNNGSSYGGPMLVMVERYSIAESRQKGGYYEFDMQFVEAGALPSPPRVDSRKILTDATSSMDKATLAAVNGQFAQTGAAGIAGRPGSATGPAVLLATRLRR